MGEVRNGKDKCALPGNANKSCAKCGEKFEPTEGKKSITGALAVLIVIWGGSRFVCSLVWIFQWEGLILFGYWSTNSSYGWHLASADSRLATTCNNLPEMP